MTPILESDKQLMMSKIGEHQKLFTWTDYPGFHACRLLIPLKSDTAMEEQIRQTCLIQATLRETPLGRGPGTGMLPFISLRQTFMLAAIPTAILALQPYP